MSTIPQLLTAGLTIAAGFQQVAGANNTHTALALNKNPDNLAHHPFNLSQRTLQSYVTYTPNEAHNPYLSDADLPEMDDDQPNQLNQPNQLQAQSNRKLLQGGNTDAEQRERRIILESSTTVPLKKMFIIDPVKAKQQHPNITHKPSKTPIDVQYVNICYTDQESCDSSLLKASLGVFSDNMRPYFGMDRGGFGNIVQRRKMAETMAIIHQLPEFINRAYLKEIVDTLSKNPAILQAFNQTFAAENASNYTGFAIDDGANKMPIRFAENGTDYCLYIDVKRQNKLETFKLDGSFLESNASTLLATIDCDDLAAKLREFEVAMDKAQKIRKKERDDYQQRAYIIALVPIAGTLCLICSCCAYAHKK